MKQTLWISAGELSGDMQAASVLKELRALAPHVDAVGMGGPCLAEAGQDNLFHTEDLSVMGVVEVFSAIPRALRMLSAMRREMARIRPDAVLLVDAPEFNFRVARIAKSLGIPAYYFIPPKVWAWRKGRVRFLRSHIRGLMCILPFEKDFYRSHGINVEYVGNPLVDMIHQANIGGLAPFPGRIGVMPGSRMKEVTRLMPLFGAAAGLLQKRIGGLSFHCLRAPNMEESLLRSLWPKDIPLVMEEPGQRYAVMRGCSAIMAASGTAVLETALVGTPTAVAYIVSPLSYLVGKTLIDLNWISLPNLILRRTLFPEFIQHDATPEKLAGQIEEWLSSPSALHAVREGMAEVARMCGPEGSARRAAAHLIACMGSLPHAEEA